MPKSSHSNQTSLSSNAASEQNKDCLPKLCKLRKLCIITSVIAYIILLTTYLSQSAHTSNPNHSQTTPAGMNDHDTFETEIPGKIQLYSHKAGKIAPNNLPHFPPPFV